MKSQTAVEWLIEHLMLDKTSPNYNKEIIDKALEREKHQIKFFFDKGHLYSGCPYGLEEVYIKNFK